MREGRDSRAAAGDQQTVQLEKGADNAAAEALDLGGALVMPVDLPFLKTGSLCGHSQLFDDFETIATRKTPAARKTPKTCARSISTLLAGHQPHSSASSRSSPAVMSACGF